MGVYNAADLKWVKYEDAHRATLELSPCFARYNLTVIPELASKSLVFVTLRTLSELFEIKFDQISISQKEMASPVDYPLQPPPPGQSSNFIDPENRGPAIAIVCLTFIILMWLILLLRLYSKAWVIRRVGWDDGKPHLLPVRSVLNL